ASQTYPEMAAEKAEIAKHEITFDPVKAQYVRVTVKPENKIPAWHGGAGHTGFVFVDEIEVN
ncbi:MAG: hypothetical protein K2H39_03765, partial [Paramuribaculum sp.]|nr:hypothetical protein [Paramuribaculum sp.]